MSKREDILFIIIVLLFAVVAAAAGQKAATPKDHNKAALGEDKVRQLLLLMDTDKNGKISKEEYMNFMEAEFDRLGKDKRGELDPKVLAQAQLRVSRPVGVGK